MKSRPPLALKYVKLNYIVDGKGRNKIKDQWPKEKHRSC